MPCPHQTSSRFESLDRADWIFLGLITIAVFLLSLRGIANHGYIGQDFVSHSNTMLSYPGSYSYYLTNPPGLYWFGSLIHHHVSARHDFALIALAFVVFNTVGLGIIFTLLWQCIALRPLRYAAAALLAFVPFRVIHSVVYAADAFTIPLFALAALFLNRLLADPRRIFAWCGLSLSLSAGMLCKYSFVGVLPPATVMAAAAIWKHADGPERPRWIAVAILALALPTGIFLRAMHLSAAAHGFTTYGQWLPPGAPSVMRWSDILTPQESDWGIFAAPQYFQDRLYGFRKFSYMGLVHVAAFTDCSNFFQKLPPAAADPASWTRADMIRDRSTAAQKLEEWSVRWCVPFSILAITGTVFCGLLSIQSVFSSRPILPTAAVTLTAMANGFYSVIFFSLHRIGDPYTAGYWLPRLVLPALLVFFALGFVMIDFLCQHRTATGGTGAILWIVTGYTAVACGLFIGFLT